MQQLVRRENDMNKRINTSQVIIRSDFDSDMYHLGYEWQKNSRVYKRIACNIHIDDIEGLLGTDIYSIAKDMKPGDSRGYCAFH